jgi:phospholipase/carboxylesterase
MSVNSEISMIGDLVVRQKVPEGSAPRKILLLLHGWTGDENSMWIFTPRFPKNYWIISPRGITKTLLGGYSWQKGADSEMPQAVDFQPAIDALVELVNSINSTEIETNRFDLMGFSQGAALAYSIALSHPERIGKLAGLSGFLPEGFESEISQETLSGKKVFVAHGRLDEMVPVSQARRVVRELKTAGAQVIYCEEDIGHKLSAGCFRGMVEYFTNSN